MCLSSSSRHKGYFPFPSPRLIPVLKSCCHPSYHIFSLFNYHFIPRYSTSVLFHNKIPVRYSFLYVQTRSVCSVAFFFSQFTFPTPAFLLVSFARCMLIPVCVFPLPVPLHGFQLFNYLSASHVIVLLIFILHIHNPQAVFHYCAYSFPFSSHCLSPFLIRMLPLLQK